MAEAIRTSSSSEAGAIRDSMSNIKDIDTILGQFSFGETGQAVYDPIILVVKTGGFEVLK